MEVSLSSYDFRYFSKSGRILDGAVADDLLEWSSYKIFWRIFSNDEVEKADWSCDTSCGINREKMEAFELNFGSLKLD